MRTAVSTLRWILWMEAGAFLIAAARTMSDPELSYAVRWVILGELIIGAFVLAAAWAMQARARWAVAAGLAVSALNVLLIVMAPFGIYGLIVLGRKSGRNQLGPKPPPLPGAEPVQRVRVMDIALLAMMIAACIPMLEYLRISEVPDIPIAMLIIGLWFEVWIVVLIHELGHCAAGWACGFELVELAVGRTVLLHQDERWQLKRVKKLGAGGLTGIRPRTADHLREKYVLFAAGGPLASLLFAVLLFGLFLASPGRPWQMLSPLIGITAVISFQTFVGNSLPLSSRTRMLRDGARVLHLSRHSAEGQRLLARLQMGLIFTTPMRPRDLPADWIQAGLIVSDGSADHMGGCIRASLFFLDRGEIEAAGRWLDEWMRLHRAWPSGVNRDGSLTEVAYFEARHRGNAAAARELLNAARGRLLVERYTSLRTWAAVLLAEGQSDAALDLIAQAHADLDRRALTGHRLFERDLLADLERSATPTVLELPCATVPL
jgi:hypothetical protein